MGQDLIAVAIQIPMRVDEQVIATIKGRIKRMPVKSLDFIGVHILGIVKEDELQEDMEVMRTCVRLHLVRSVDTVLGWLLTGESSPRDIIVVPLGGMTMLICGGSSWGDSPGDSFDAACALAQADICMSTEEELGVARQKVAELEKRLVEEQQS